MVENYVAIYLIDVTALVLLCWLIHSNNVLNLNRKGPFYLGAALTVMIILSEAGTIIAADGNADLRFWSIICNTFGFALSPIIPIVLIAIFDIKILQSKKLIMLPSILNMVLTALSPWFAFVFYVDENNHYARGSFFFIFVATYIINLIILLISVVKVGKRDNYQIQMKITVLTLFAIAGTSIQLIMPSVYSSWHSVTLSLFLYYILLSEFDGSFDTLTRLYNRAAYEKRITKLDGSKPYSVVVMDINNFKEINDTYGHDFGDTVLKKVASIISESFDRRCACYRVGGDEFYVISSETDPIKLEDHLRNMTSNLEKERQNEGRLPTVAYGYSVLKDKLMINFQEVVKEADAQMYYYKKVQKGG